LWSLGYQEVLVLKQKRQLNRMEHTYYTTTFIIPILLVLVKKREKPVSVRLLVELAQLNGQLGQVTR
jgi:hypothetical protein